MRSFIRLLVMVVWFLLTPVGNGAAAEPAASPRTYRNELRSLKDPPPLLADHPNYIQPIADVARFEAPALIEDANADLAVRGWRWSYNARGIIEVPNQLRGAATAVVVVHPWGIDDGQGWRTPEPAGCAFQCTPAKNQYVRQHVRDVIEPLLQRLRDRVGMVVYSLPGKEDPIRQKLYRSVRQPTSAASRKQGQQELEAKLAAFSYQGEPLPSTLQVSTDRPFIDYFRQFPGLDAGDRYNRADFWNQPIPVIKEIQVALDDVVIYDAEGYPVLRDFLREHGIRHVLLLGYNTDMCICSTTAGYKNLQQDFDVFLVGDATLATFPANQTPAFATNAAVSYAALNLMITQASWIR